MVLCGFFNELYMEKGFNSIMKKYILSILSFFLVMFLNGCEDDPLLAPQTESEDDGGSYGNLSLPGDENDANLENPEIF